MKGMDRMDFYDNFNLFSTIYGGFFLIVFVVSILLAGHKQEKTSECLGKECRYFDEETGCLLGWNKEGACPYIEEETYGQLPESK